MMYSQRYYPILCSLLFVSVLVTTGCSTPPPPQVVSEPQAFRVMSYNIRYNNPGDGEHAWPNRKERVISTIRFNQADLIGVQEALKEQVDEMAANLDGFEWIGVGRDDGESAGEYAPIFYRASRFSLLDSGTFWLSKNPDVPGSKDWDAAITRLVTWAHFSDQRSDTTLFHFNTHFDHRGEIAREKSAELLAHRIQRIAGNHPVVVTGDFNFVETTNGYSTLTESLDDAMFTTHEPHHGPTGTFSGFVMDRPIERRIDFIFVSKHLPVLQHAILSDNWNGAFASDHLAVLATIDLLPRQP